ncbi:nucleotidyltransferase domain-containing protein [Streptomyces sp. NPDC054797]
MSNALGQWAPLSPVEVSELFEGAKFPWWIAGGYAIELAVGRPLRPHDDVDILVLRRDQAAIQAHLTGWDLHVADPPGAGQLRPWLPEESLELPLNGVWSRPGPEEPWAFELMLDEADGDDWVSRRNPRVRLPITRLGRVTPGGIPYLSPEIQLYYKAKAVRAKDELDFEAALPLLGNEQRFWLRDAFETTAPSHPWIERLR